MAVLLAFARLRRCSGEASSRRHSLLRSHGGPKQTATACPLGIGHACPTTDKPSCPAAQCRARRCL